jgi:hypothetical protein
VLGPDVGSRGAFEPVLDERDLAGRLEAAAERLEHRRGLLELVVHVHHQDPVEAARRKLRVGLGPEHGHHALHAFGRHVLLQQLEHLGLDVLRVDPAARRHDARHPACEPARAAAHVGHDVAVLQAHRPEDLGGALLLLASLALEPRGAASRDDVRGLSRRSGRGRRGGRRLRHERPSESEGQQLHGLESFVAAGPQRPGQPPQA